MRLVGNNNDDVCPGKARDAGGQVGWGYGMVGVVRKGRARYVRGLQLYLVPLST